MTADTQNPQNSGISTEMKRRSFVRTVGMVAGASAVGASTQTDMVPSPVGGAHAFDASNDALPLGLAGTTVASPAAGAAGIYLFLKGQAQDVDLNPEDNSQTRVWSAANGIASTRAGPKGPRREIENTFKNKASGESAYAHAAMAEMRTAAAKAVFEGRSDEAESDALDAVNRQTTRSLTMLFETWNQAVLTMAESGTMLENYNQGADSLHAAGGDVAPIDGYADTASLDLEQISSQSPEGENGTLLYKYNVPSSLPSPSSFEDRDTGFEVYCPTSISASTDILGPCTFKSHTSLFDEDTGGFTKGSFEARHPDLDTQVILDGSLYDSVISQIATEYNDLKANLSDYVQTLVDGLEQGTIEPTEVFGPRDLATEYGSSDKRAQLAREYMAIGAGLPDDVGYRARVSHPALEADSLWTDLYLDLADGMSVDLNGPTTIPSADYNSALIGYYGETTGEYLTRSLPGSSDLQVLEVDMQEQNVLETNSVTVGTDGRIELGSPDELPPPYSSPETKYDDWEIVFQAANGNTHATSRTDLVIEDDLVYLPSSSLSEGQTIEQIRANPPNTYTSTSQGIIAPADYDAATAQENIEHVKELNQKIEEAIEQAENPDGFAGFGLGSLSAGAKRGIAMLVGGILLIFGFIASLS